MSKVKDIIVLVGSATGSALALIRSIKKEVDCKAYILCTNQNAAKIISTSIFVDEVKLISSANEEEYVQNIKDWYERKSFNEKPILYFTYDTACFYINNNREWFEERFKICLPSTDIIKTFTQKGLAEKEATYAGLDVPKTKVLEHLDDTKLIVEEFNFPVILKPRATYLNKDIKFKLKVISEKDKFLDFSSEVLKNGESLLCQEFIPGGDDVSYYYLFYRANDGSIIENIGRKTLQSTPNGGIMAKGIVEYNTELATISRGFLNKIDYKGIGGLEYKKYQEKYFFIEMNTRVEAILEIAEISNSPLSLASYYDLTDNKEALQKAISSKQNDGYTYIDLIPTITARIKSHKYFKLIGDLLTIVFDKKVKLNIYSRFDPKPFWLSLKTLIFK